MNQHRTVQLVQEAIAAAMVNDADGAATALQTLGENSTTNEMYGVCCAIAAAGKHALTLLYGKQAKGTQWAIEEIAPGSLKKDPAKTFSVRFLVAFASDDTSTCLALYQAAVKATDEEYVDSVLALLADTASILRLALEERDAGRLPA